MHHLNLQQGRMKAAVVLLSLLPLTLACGGEDKGNPESKPEVAAAASQVSIKTQPLESDPCKWVTLAEVEELVGKVEGPPQTRAQDGGTACVYTLPEASAKRPAYALPGMTPPPAILTIRIDFSDPLTYEAASGIGAQLVAQDPAYQAAVAAQEIKEPAKPEGWDYFGEGVSGSVFRVGHMAVVIGVFTPRHFTGEQQTAIAVKLATLIRGRVPDLPVATENPEWSIGSGAPNPCSLVTREEAEAVMGKLMLPPYRSEKTKPFVHDKGQACSYYRGQHRVLVLTPYWRGGRELFQLASGLTEEFTSKTGVGEQSADTLEGPWDQAQADIDGTLNFLVGDRMLEFKHGMSGMKSAEALKLAQLAVERLAKMDL